METIYDIDGARLNKCEIDILQFIDSWLPTFQTWSVQELSQKCGLFTDEASHAVDMLILHGLMENTDEDALTGRVVQVPDIAQAWMRENAETLNGLHMMNDCGLFDESETATA